MLASYIFRQTCSQVLTGASLEDQRQHLLACQRVPTQATREVKSETKEVK
jgi:hypothetical protein